MRLRRFAVLAVSAGLLAGFATGAVGAGPVDPSFAPGGPLPVGGGPVSVADADVNGDGKPDLVVARRNSNDVTVLLGDGAGGFRASAGSPIAVGRSPESVAVADFDGDGNVDVTVANAGSSDLTILLGNGAGGFRPAPSSPIRVAGLRANVAAADVTLTGTSTSSRPITTRTRRECRSRSCSATVRPASPRLADRH